MSQKDNIRRLIMKHTDRLQILKEQEAQQGLSVEPKILTEIADIEQKIETLELQLETTSDEEEEIPPFKPSASSESYADQPQTPSSYGGVQIGSVGGDIKGSIIAGGDVSQVQMNYSEQEGLAGQEPTFDAFKQLLAEIRQELAALKTEQEALKTISSLSPRKVEDAQGYLEEAAETAETAAEADGESLLEYLEEASKAVGSVLDKANKKADAVGAAVKPVTEKLGPLLTKLATAAAWAAKLWLIG